ncbi:hypothetical protein [Leptolyngbya phage Lbo-JY46]
MKNFFLNLLKSNSGISSRRFIALLMLPAYITGLFVGVFSKEFNFFLVAMIAAAIPIFISYFLLTWEHIKEITKNIISPKKTQDERLDM